MIRKFAVAVPAALALLVGCEGGDINISPTNIDNSVDNSETTTGGGGSSNPCANYTDPDSNTLVQGNFDGSNCTYPSEFVGVGNPLRVDLTIPFITGVHIFEDSLFVGQNVDSGPAPASGEGPTLTIRAGNTLAFLDSADYVLVNRGSQLVAQGTQSAPITFTAYVDAVLGQAGAEETSLWGGLQINGNGVTNNCTDDERASNQCHVLTEGQPSNYGGSDNEDSSGVYSYVVTKHSGFEVAPGDELNGITFNAVGSGTQVDHVEVYSTFDDGLEWFGGAVSVSQVVVVYSRDDSLDYSDGWVGGITDALVIQQQFDGNRCIEADNIGAGRSSAGEPLDFEPISNPTINGLTCIVSVMDDGTHGDAEGILLRLGARGQLNNALVFSGYAEVASASGSNECFEFDDDLTRDFAQAGQTVVSNSVIACSLPTQDSLGNGDGIDLWLLNQSGVGADYSFNPGNVIITDATNPNLSILEPNSFLTANYDDGADVTTITLPDGVTTVPISGRLGGVDSGNDWTVGWTFGLRAPNQAQPLYFQ